LTTPPRASASFWATPLPSQTWWLGLWRQYGLSNSFFSILLSVGKYICKNPIKKLFYYKRRILQHVTFTVYICRSIYLR
jgi:hypothetical protein